MIVDDDAAVIVIVLETEKVVGYSSWKKTERQNGIKNCNDDSRSPFSRMREGPPWEAGCNG